MRVVWVLMPVGVIAMASGRYVEQVMIEGYFAGLFLSDETGNVITERRRPLR
jgi:hypothetical protein